MTDASGNHRIQILCVDDDALILETLQLMFEAKRTEWEMRYANSGAEALRMMAESPADVVVSDMRMPGMNGAELLNEIMRRHPRTVRFILSGYADVDLILRCVGNTHQYLSKPCDILSLESVVRRAVDMDRWVNNDQVKAIVSRTTNVPSLPSLYFEILDLLQSPEVSLEEVGGTIAKDPAMTAKMLQMVNSAFFGLAYHLSNPTEAVMQLGMETVKSLVLAIHVFSEFESQPDAKFNVEQIYNHSLATATTARRLGRVARLKENVCEEAFTAGLVHDIGRLVLISNLPKEFSEAVARAQADDIPLMEGERMVFGASHAEVGGYLLGLWGLPTGLVETAVFHHRPSLSHSQTIDPLTMVHLANTFEHDRSADGTPVKWTGLDQEYLTRIGAWEQVPKWRDELKAAEFE